MNICLLKESLAIGGTERSAANISQALAPEHTVYMALFDTGEIQYPFSGELLDLHLPPQRSLPGKIYNTFLRDYRLRRLIKQKKIDILYTFTGIGNRQTHYRYKNTVKIISARDFGGMCQRHEEYHHALLHSDAMICNSEYTREFYLSRYPEHADRVFALHNYIHVDEICSQRGEATEPEFDAFVSSHDAAVVSVGRFCKEKGFEHLIDAFSRARSEENNLGLVLIGDGPLKESYLQTIEKHDLQNHVYFTGFQTNPYKYMNKCSCFVLSSLSEGFPNVLAEAMALGLPVIAANCLSGPAEILRKDSDYSAVTEQFLHCDYGIITPAMEEEASGTAIDQMAAAIASLLSDRDMMQHYSALSALRAGDFSKEATRQKLNEIFATLAERRDLP